MSEIDIASGQVVKTMSGKQFKAALPVSMTVDGPDLFLDTINSSGKGFSTLTEVDLASGQVVEELPNGTASRLTQAIEVLSDGPYVFTVNLGQPQLSANGISYGAASLAQIDARTGSIVRVISGARYDFNGATAMSVLGHDLYVADAGANAVTEVDTTTGALVRVLSGARYGFDGPDGEAVWGDHLYVANGEGNTVTDIEFGPGPTTVGT